MCVEVVRASIGGRYSRRSIEAKREAGYSPVSPVDRHYGGVWMGRPCPECRCQSPEECLTLQELGTHCELVTAEALG